MDTQRISNRQIIKALQKIKLEDNSLLVIRKGTDFSENMDIQRLSDMIVTMGLKNIAIIIADSTADIGKIPEHRLNEAGWYKLSKVAKFLEDRDGSKGYS